MRAVVLTAWITSTVAVPARAQSLGPSDNHFTLDLYQGPILAPGRVMAMGGAYTGYAEGIGAFTVNAAAPAVRHTHSTNRLELDIDASVSFPIVLFKNNDFDNSGDFDADYQSYIYLAAGGLIQAGNFGAGFFADLQRYSISFPPSEVATIVTVGRYHLLAAYQVLGGQLVFGAGARALSLGVSAPGKELTSELGMFGVAPEVGFLVKPTWSPFRIGATYRHSVGGLLRTDDNAKTDERGVLRAGGLIVPDDVQLPWELGVGVAFQVGPRPLNPSWIDPRDHERELEETYRAKREARRKRIASRLAALPEGSERAQLRPRMERELAEADARDARALERDRARLQGERRAILRNWPRDYLLVTADLVVTGPVARGVSIERFLGQGYTQDGGPCHAVGSGESINFSPRVGLEIEPVPKWMHVRFGSYYEPNRFRYQPEACNDRIGRQHFTFGADVKTFSTTWWGLVNEVTYKIQAYGDLAPRYQSFGAGFGVWY
jgi:hypothetical protein